MKVVIDTNVLVSGFFFPGKPSLILKAWRNGLLQPVMSTEVFDEFREVLIRLSRKYPAVQVGPLIDLVAVEIPLITALKLKKKICDDPDDDKFLPVRQRPRPKLSSAATVICCANPAPWESRCSLRHSSYLITSEGKYNVVANQPRASARRLHWLVIQP